MNMRILDPKLWLLYMVKVAEIFKNGLFFRPIPNTFIRKLDLVEVSFLAFLDRFLW